MLNQKTRQIFEKNGGVLTLPKALECGLSKEGVRKMYLRGELEKVHAGVYTLKNDLPDELLLLQTVYSKGVLSHESAAALYGFTSFTPTEPIFSFPQGYKLYRNPKLAIAPYFVSREQYQTGIKEVQTWEGNPILAYNPEKTLVDLARSRYTLPLIFEEVMQGYFALGNVNVERLLGYAQQFGVLDKMKKGMTVYA